MVVLAASARLDADDVLRIRCERPPADCGVLTLRRDGTEKAVPPEGTAAGLSRVDLSRVDLAEGTWSVHVAGAEVLTTDPGFSLDGLAEYARRRRTRVLRAFRAPAGGLRVLVRGAAPYAEVTAVHPGEDMLVVEGFLAFGATPAGTDITATRRETGQVVTGRATVTGDRWRTELPTAPFAVETARGFWDLRLGGLDVAAWLDDVPNKKNKIRYPARYVARDGEQVRVRVRPYYTDADKLAIATTAVDAGRAGTP